MTTRETPPVVASIDGVEIRWTGGRLADVWMPTRYDPAPHAVECLEHPGWDGATFSFKRAPTRLELRLVLSRWMRDHYSEAWENA
jgi:hypothetical protein